MSLPLRKSDSVGCCPTPNSSMPSLGVLGNLLPVLNGKFSCVRETIPIKQTQLPNTLPSAPPTPSLLLPSPNFLFSGRHGWASSLHARLLFPELGGGHVMRACVLLALVVAAGAVKSLWSSVSNHTDKGGALRQEDELLCRAPAGVDYATTWHLTSGWERQGTVTSGLNNGSSRSSASSEHAA